MAILPYLMAGFAASATATFGLVWVSGTLIRTHLHIAWSLVYVLLFAACAVADLAHPRIRCSAMRRQTPKRLIGSVPASIGGLVWGLDTGTVISTYRTSAASWAALTLAFAGWAPWWGGIAYAAGFGLPLAVLVLIHTPSASRQSRQLARIASADTFSTIVPRLLSAVSAFRIASALLALTTIGVLLSNPLQP
jgi:hypothetical protein